MIELMKKPKLVSDPPPSPRLRPGQVDDLAEAIMVLTRELWVITDRLAALEARLEARNLVTSDEVDRHQPDEAAQKALKARCDALIANVEQAMRGLGY